MSPKTRVLALILIMISTIVATEAITITILYNAATRDQRSRLEVTAKSQARLIEAVARFDAEYSTDYPRGSRQATLSQIKDFHDQYHGFGETGEFTLSMLENDQIVFLLNHRHSELQSPEPIPWSSELAEPMRRALSGESGTIIGLDYRGQKVLAAYEPLAELDLGIVAKIDLAEIRAPFIKAGLLSGICAILASALGVALFLKITNPILIKLQDSVAQLSGEVNILRRIVPICSYCKKIRDDKGYWDQVEVYFAARTEAEFSHGICPECKQEHFPST